MIYQLFILIIGTAIGIVIGELVRELIRHGKQTSQEKDHTN